jgi:hypothetical protein
MVTLVTYIPKEAAIAPKTISSEIHDTYPTVMSLSIQTCPHSESYLHPPMSCLDSTPIPYLPITVGLF